VDDLAELMRLGLGALSSGSDEDEAPPRPVNEPKPEAPEKRPPVVVLDEDDVEALARVLQSEAALPRFSDAERYGIGRTVLNRARRRRRSVYDLVAPLGREQRGGDPPFSTARAPKEADYTLARRLLAESDKPDPTHGAGAFFEPALQDELKRRGDAYRAAPDVFPEYKRFAKYRRSADEIRASWGPMLARIGRFEFYR
jgi:hypothetical protein